MSPKLIRRNWIERVGGFYFIPIKLNSFFISLNRKSLTRAPTVFERSRYSEVSLSKLVSIQGKTGQLAGSRQLRPAYLFTSIKYLKLLILCDFHSCVASSRPSSELILNFLEQKAMRLSFMMALFSILFCLASINFMNSSLSSFKKLKMRLVPSSNSIRRHCRLVRYRRSMILVIYTKGQYFQMGLYSARTKEANSRWESFWQVDKYLNFIFSFQTDRCPFLFELCLIQSTKKIVYEALLVIFYKNDFSFFLCYASSWRWQRQFELLYQNYFCIIIFFTCQGSKCSTSSTGRTPLPSRNLLNLWRQAK